jgi:shikimate kinase
MGSGKSTVGARLATTLQRPLLDSDVMVEARTGRTVREIWEAEGEPAYRVLEADALRDAVAADTPSVIAAAGGVVLRVENRALLAGDRAFVVWLRADPEVLVARALTGDHRPLLDQDPLGRLRAMEAERRPLYEEVADMAVEVADRTPGEVAAVVLAALAELASRDPA